MDIFPPTGAGADFWSKLASGLERLPSTSTVWKSELVGDFIRDLQEMAGRKRVEFVASRRALEYQLDALRGIPHHVYFGLQSHVDSGQSYFTPHQYHEATELLFQLVEAVQAHYDLWLKPEAEINADRDRERRMECLRSGIDALKQSLTSLTASAMLSQSPMLQEEKNSGNAQPILPSSAAEPSEDGIRSQISSPSVTANGRPAVETGDLSSTARTGSSSTEIGTDECHQPRLQEAPEPLEYEAETLGHKCEATSGNEDASANLDRDVTPTTISIGTLEIADDAEVGNPHQFSALGC